MKWFAAWCLAVLLGLVWADQQGYVLLPDSDHTVMPSSVRGSPGAFRHYRHWGGGSFHGGK